MKKRFAFLIVLSLSYGYGKAQPTDGYVVSWNYDTLPVKILYIDIVNIQKVLRVESPNGVELLYPKDIRAFGLYKNPALKLIDFANYGADNVHSSGDKRGMLGGEWSSLTSAEKLNLFDSESLKRGYINFTSITLDSSYSFFSRDIYGSHDGIQVYSHYYLKASSQLLVPVQWLNGDILTFKEGRYVPYPVGAGLRKHRHWISDLVSDYKLLSTLIIHKEFPGSYDLVINSYEEWRHKKSSAPSAADTLAVMRGIFDAKKHYKPKKFFWPTFAGATAVSFPGQIIGVSKVMKARRDFSSIEVPNVNAAYFNDERYKLGYRTEVIAKSQRAIERGIGLGTLLCVAILIPLSL